MYSVNAKAPALLNAKMQQDKTYGNTDARSKNVGG